MLVGFRRGGADHVVDVDVRPGATVADLAEALAAATGGHPLAPPAGDGVPPGGSAPPALTLDGRPLDPAAEAAACGLAPGCDLRPTGGGGAVPPDDLPGPRAPAAAPGWAGGGGSLPPAAARPRPAPVAVAAELRVVGGPAAGTRLPLPPGPSLVGRRAPAGVVLDAPTVSAAHLTVTVAPDGTAAVADAGSANGTRVDGAWATGATAVAVDPGAVVAAGAVRLAVVPAAAIPAPARLGPPRPDGRRPFHRPPRPPSPPPPAAVAVPDHPPAARRAMRPAVAALVAPLVAGAVAAAVFGHPALALLALLGPVTAGGTWLEDRRRSRRDARRRAEQSAAGTARLAADVAAAARAEARRRRAAHPDVAELAARAEVGGVGLWERRPPAGDLLTVAVGHADLPWLPPLAGTPVDPAAAGAVEAAGRLADVPVPVDLSATVLGVAGPRPAALAVARAVVLQLATLAGPAHVRVAVLATPRTAGDWAWAAWLPHVAAGGGATLLGATADERAAVVAHLDEGPPAVTVIDGEEAADGAAGPAGGGRTVVVADRPAHLPAGCTAVLHVAADGRATLTTAAGVVDLLATGVPAGVATRAARRLARLADPEAAGAAALPSRVALLDLLGLQDPSPGAVAARWEAGRPGLPAVVGAGPGGPFTVDLVADGPHVLVAGTTGSGKSELLRTLVASLAATTRPDELAFVLLDYKGGSAFDRCADLPHVTGVVTDLDDHLARRALVCLDAELRERERVLRAAGAADLDAYRSVPGRHPVPRLVVVVDEFATLAAELPGFVDALLGVAQRGRSLGIHLVLATQRPAGVVSEAIRANTNLRIALRVQDRSASVDVVGAPDAASFGRQEPGRAVARLGPGDLVAFQVALATAPATAGRPPVTARRVVVGPGGDAGPVPGRGTGGGSDLDRLVAAVAGAARHAGVAPPRRPWPDPLPDRLDLADLPPGAVALADEPDRQRVAPFRWDPAGGHLLVLGMPGSGVTTTVAAVAVALATAAPPDRLHLAVLDCGSGGLAPLAALPHVGAVVGPAEGERRERLLRMVHDEVDARRAGRHDGRRLVLVIDGVGALRAACDGLAGLELMDGLARVLADGPAVGVTAVLAAESSSAVPASMASLATDRLVLRQADPVAWAAAGVAPRSVPDLSPGRALHLPTGRLVQVGLPGGGDLAAAVARSAARWPEPPAGLGPAPVGVLPADVAAGALPAATVVDGRWLLPVGLGDRHLLPVGLPLDEGDAALVTGPPRSGRSTALAVIAGRAAAAGLRFTAVAARPSPLREVAGTGSAVTDADGLAAAIDAVVAPHLVLVDDADTVDDAGGLLARLAAGGRPGVRLVVAARSDAVRRSAVPWLGAVRRARTGLFLRPDVEPDADVFAAPLPRRRRPAPGPGRGFLVADGRAELVQVARP